MIVSINQPAYLPWPGYFERIALSDLHIVLDHVQFEKNSLTNRNKIRVPVGWSWLTVPLVTSGRFGDLGINTIEIVPTQQWAKKHRNALQSNYARAAFFAEHAQFFDEVLQQSWNLLGNLTRTTTEYLLKALQIETPIFYSSQMNASGHKEELILKLCQEVGATTYISGPFGRDYLDLEKWGQAGIEVLFHDYSAPIYPQVFPGFEPGLSAIDLLFNCGPQSRDILMGCGKLSST